MQILMEAAAAGGRQFPVAFVAVYAIGFIAAVTIGSIAWYNSKRPPGWEASKRPSFIPKTNANEEETSSDRNS